MPTLSSIQSQLAEHEQWLIDLRQDSRTTLATIKAALEEQKGVTASQSQLETYFRNLGQRKNLSRPDWIAVFRALDSQKAFGRIFDLYVSGKLITEQSLRMKRKNAKPAQTLASCLADADQLLAHLPDGVTVKLRLSQDCSGSNLESLSTPEPVSHPDSVADPNGGPNILLASISVNKDTASGPSAIHVDAGASSSSAVSRPASSYIPNDVQVADFPARMEAYIDYDLGMPGELDCRISPPSFGIENDVMDLEIENRAAFFVSSPPISDIWARGSSLPKLQHSLWPQDSVNQNGLLMVGSAEFGLASPKNATNDDRFHVVSLIASARLLVEQFSGMASGCELRVTHAPVPPAEEILDNLLSLVSLETAGEDFYGSLNITRDAGEFRDRFVQLLLFSIANNFAGIGVIPKRVIIEFINQYEPVRSSIMSHLKDRASISSIALVGNLLEAAIEADDTKTVQNLLALKIVAPDDIVCMERFPDDHHTDAALRNRRTALEKASMLRHFDIMELLLQFGADVNKTYFVGSKDDFMGRGALECAIGTWGKYRPLDPRFMDLLLNNGATVSGRLALAAVRWGDKRLLEKLMSRLTPSEHVDYFHAILSDAAEYLRNDLGHQVIRQVIQACRDTHDNTCIRSQGYALKTVMTKAARRKNNDLVLLLIPHGGQDGLDQALTAASQSGSHALVHLLLAHGARGDGPACSIDEPSTFEEKKPDTTPLAEAIRGDDPELVEILAKEGAWDRIAEPGRLEAAMHAIAETGNLDLLFHVLQLVPNPEPGALTRPLSSAIRFRHEEIALRLLEAGADVGGHYRATPFLAAFDNPRSCPETALEAATKWGNAQIIKTLVFMGADISSYNRAAPLSIAIMTGSRSLIELLINLGADLNSDSKMSHLLRPLFFHDNLRAQHSADLCASPLAAAALARDAETANYLLDHGADPADEEAIINAATHYRSILNIILQKFGKNHPNGRTGFGGTVLQHGLQTQDEALLDLCLSAGFDVNNMTRHIYYGFVTALGTAIKKYRGGRLDLISKLLGPGGNVDVPTSKTHQLSSSANSRGYVIDITILQTALLDAIETKSLPLVELIISRGADVRKEAKLGLKRTPLQKACEVASHSIVDLLLELNVDVNAAPAVRGGATALQLAAKAGSLRIAKKLLAFGADVKAPGVRFWGHSAIEYAAEYGRLSMITLLWNAAGGRFAASEYESAIVLAQENGHPACALQLRNLSSGNQGVIDSGGMANDGGKADVVL